jgi:hypothetical protein
MSGSSVQQRPRFGSSAFDLGALESRSPMCSHDRLLDAAAEMLECAPNTFEAVEG